MGFSDFTLINILITTVAAFLAGGMNAIAGGGSFFAFPALVFVGVPGIMANATSAMAVLPGYIAGSVGFHAEIAGFDRKALSRFCLVAIFGSLIGASLLLITSRQFFDFLIPILLILATLLFAFSPKLLNYLRSIKKKDSEKPIINPYIGLFFVSIYGGYFNGGLGILLLALFAIIGLEDIHMMNGLKGVLSFVLSLISTTIFALAGLVDWRYALIMMVAAMLGGYLGARLSRIMPRSLIRSIVISVGIFMSIAFIYRLI